MREGAVRRSMSLGAVLAVAMLATLWAKPVSATETEGPSRWTESLGLPETGARVVVIPVRGEVTPGSAAFVTRSLAHVAASAAHLAVIDIDTFGGRVDAAVTIRDAILELDAPVVAYVHNRAISAGALIAYAADSIVFSDAASMGAATPIQIRGGEAEPVDEKMVSYMRAEMRATAEANGRRADLAEAMVDRLVAVEDVVDEETLLTVTTREALELGIADASATSLEALFGDLGVAAADVSRIEPNWAERLAAFITSPVVAGLLMTLGLLGIWVEVKAPGFGVPGVLGTLALVAFFFGHMVVHLAGWEEVLLLTAGLILIAIEVLLIPGFGLPGVMGVVSLAFAFVMAMTGLPIGVAWEVGALELASVRVFVSLLVVVLGAILVARYIPESAYPQWLVLRTAIEDEAGARQHAAVGGDAAGLVGRRGLAVTDLRPSGTARVEGKLFDVVGRGPWIEAGEPIVVLEVDGVRVLVDRPEAEPDPPMNQS